MGINYWFKMLRYHVIMTVVGVGVGMEFNLEEEYVRQKIVAPYVENRTFHFAGRVVSSPNIEMIDIFATPSKFEDIILPNGKHANEEDDTSYIRKCFGTHKVKGVTWLNAHFQISPPEEKEEPIKTPTKPLGKKEKVFIVHGRDETQALRLQKYLLHNLKIKARMFEDFKEKSSSNTIIEQLEFIKDNVGYAFIIATPDDYGCLCKEMDNLKNRMLIGKKSLEVKKVVEMFEHNKTRARQNVVFEFGLFIGALGRDNVCCLVQKDTQEKPTDIDGILYVKFDKSVKETFVEITEKLKKADLVKT